MLHNEYKKMPRWSDDTVLKAFRLKFACGSLGYAELLQQNLPLPSIRTLQRRLENLKFGSGICEEVFLFLQVKVSLFPNEIDKECMLVLDEMSITPGKFYDASIGNYTDEATFPGDTGVADHALVFMLAGISARWKQVVGYYFTSSGVNGEKFKPIIISIIEKAEEIDLRVSVITSDMGASNQAMWRAFGIGAGRYVNNNSCEHPCSNDRRLYFHPDTPHGLKNIKDAILNNDHIILPQYFIDEFQLPSNKVECSHLNDVIAADEGCDLKLAPKLKKEFIDKKNHFQKMSVKKANYVLSYEVSSALKYLANNDLKDHRLTTAKFTEVVAKWFSIMTARSTSVGLGYLKPKKYEETITFLKDVIKLFRNIQVGKKSIWKPIQTSVTMSTKTVIQLSKYLLKERGFTFFLASRLTQDCLENLFSIIRMKNVVPNTVQFRNNLKLILISQFITRISNSSYENDDREYLTQFLDILTTNKVKQQKTAPKTKIHFQHLTRTIQLSVTEKNKLYNIAGYIISSISKNRKACTSCIKETGSLHATWFHYSSLTRCKARSENTLFFVNPETFCFFTEMEKLFQFYSAHLRNVNLKWYFLKSFKEIPYTLPNCHNLKDKIMSRFYEFRLKVASRPIPCKNGNNYNSKSMVMHAIVK